LKTISVMSICQLFSLSIIIGMTFVLTGCREKAVVESTTVRIGLSYPAEVVEVQTRLREGLDLALEEINASGGVLDKPVEFLFIDDQDDPDMAMQIADYFSNEDLAAVIGHWSSNACYYAEDIYEEAGLVMFSPAATSSSLFRYEYNNIFRMLPGDETFARYIADFAVQRGLQRFALFYSNDEFGRDLSKLAERSLKEYGIPVVDRVNVLTTASAEDVFFRWDAFGCDGVIIASGLKSAVLPISLIRQRYPDMPILSSESLNKLTVQNDLGANATNLFVITYHPDTVKPDFYRRYTEAYEHDPDLFAIAGYVSLRLLADAMNTTQSTDGSAIAEWLENLQNHDTVIGTLSYDEETHAFKGQSFVIAEIGGRE
jgi:branched-chain amino acid transport system substrate-binding protein